MRPLGSAVGTASLCTIPTDVIMASEIQSA